MFPKPAACPEERAAPPDAAQAAAPEPMPELDPGGVSRRPRPRASLGEIAAAT